MATEHAIVAEREAFGLDEQTLLDADWKSATLFFQWGLSTVGCRTAGQIKRAELNSGHVAVKREALSTSHGASPGHHVEQKLTNFKS